MEFEAKCISINNLFKMVVGIRGKTFFWKDAWCGNMVFEGLMFKSVCLGGE